jgi:putative ABC transport system permease protein
MNLGISFENGFREIWSHKFRSGLSMLGIVLGVSSLVATLALTAGIERGSRAFMAQMGGLELVRIVDQEISNENLDFWNLSPGRTLQDAAAIRQSANLISHISPELQEGLPVSSGTETMRVRVTGAWPDYMGVASNELAAGRFISDLDGELSNRAVVIGHSIAKQMWPNLPPEQILGETLFVREVPFEVIGVFIEYIRESDRRAEKRKSNKPQTAEQARRSGGNRDPFRGKNQAVVIPFSTMFYEFKSGKFPEDSVDTVRLNDFNIRIGDLNSFAPALDQVRRIMNQTHRGVDDFGFDTREEWFDNMERNIRGTRISGGLIALISLLVGGIGITNIMLASITERVREIGIRRAVGAKARDIFLQILIESVSIALMGGILGVLCGFGLIDLLIRLAPSDNEPFVTVGAVLLSVTFAAVAGIVSGIYPAIQASRLDPIQALRYE